MRPTFDFSPLFRASIGFDRVLNALENSARLEAADAWPPYDIIKLSKDEYRISVAVAGFSPEELVLTHEPNVLIVAGQKASEDKVQYLHRGIAQRAFQHRFELADHVKVTGANLVDGLLTIELVREVPEAMKPRRIQIAAGTAEPRPETRQIQNERSAA